MDAVPQKRKRGRPLGRKRYTERLPSVLVTPADSARLAEILLKRRMSASELLRELISREHRRLKGPRSRQTEDGDGGCDWAA